MYLTNLFLRARSWLTKLLTPFYPAARSAAVSMPLPFSEWLKRYQQAALYGDEAGRREAVHALVRLSPVIKPVLIQRLCDENPHIRACIIEVMLDADPANLTQYLTTALDDGGGDMLPGIIPALAGIALPFESLLPLLEAPQPRLRIIALNLLGNAGDTSAVRLMTGMALYEEDDQVRAEAILALAKIRHPRSVATLNRALYHDDRLVARRAGEALLRIGTPQAKLAVTQWRERQFGSTDDYLSRRAVFDQIRRDRRMLEKFRQRYARK